MNGYLWHVLYVRPNDPALVDRTGRLTLGTTDPLSKTVYLSGILRGRRLEQVLLHELGHCALISYDLLDDIHAIVKRDYWVYAEEWVCNALANYFPIIFETARKLLY